MDRLLGVWESVGGDRRALETLKQRPMKLHTGVSMSYKQTRKIEQVKNDCEQWRSPYYVRPLALIQG